MGPVLPLMKRELEGVEPRSLSFRDIISAMMRFSWKKIGVLMAFMGSAFLIQSVPVLAAGCYEQGGTCAYGTTACGGNQTLIPADNCQGGVCCKSVGQTCVANGGSCTIVSCQGDDVSIGLQDCGTTNGLPSVCCRPANVAPPAASLSGTTGFANGGSGSGSTVSGKAPSALALPACTKNGNCTLADIVQTGVNFATFLMGLSGALFFAVFIYGGAMYLLSFGDKKRVEKGKSAITGAAIGLFFVMAAWTIVQTLVKGLGAEKALTSGASVQNSAECAAAGAGYACTSLNGKTVQEAQADATAKNFDCKTGLCGGGNNVMCCKPK